MPAWQGTLDGHRNPKGLDRDPLSGLLWETEHGRVTSDQVILKGQGRVRDVASGPYGYVYMLLNDDSRTKG